MWRAPYICGYDALGMRSNIGPGISRKSDPGTYWSIVCGPENLKFSGPRVSSSKPQASSSKLLTAGPGYYMMHLEREKKIMITDKEYRILMTDVYRKIITAVNITTGDDGTKAHKVIETFSELWKMNKKEYEQQQKYFG